MNSSVLFGLGTIVAWGFWIVFGELASDTIDPVTVAAISYVAVAVVPSATPRRRRVVRRDRLRARFFSTHWRGRRIGVLSTFVGVSSGSTAIVSTIGSMYFVTAAVIGIAVLGGSLSATKAVGIGLALLTLVVNQ